MTTDDMLSRMDEIGTELHFNHFPAGWAWAVDAPFQWTKQVASHLGGVRNPMIVKWPARFSRQGETRTQFLHVIDIAPTILEAASIPEPRSVNGTAQTPIQGKSFLSTLDDAGAEEVRTSQYFEMFVNRGIYKDGWWAASLAFEPWIPCAARSIPSRPNGSFMISKKISARHGTLLRTTRTSLKS